MKQLLRTKNSAISVVFGFECSFLEVQRLCYSISQCDEDAKTYEVAAY